MQVKVIGLLGGMSWESTATYYAGLNRGVRDRLGGLHSARCVLYSVDFAAVEEMQAAGQWDEAGEFLAGCARQLEAAGSEGIVLATNTMHRVYPALAAAVSVPVLHIADATYAALASAGISRAALLGTRYTMEQPFYTERLTGPGPELLIPDAADRQLVHEIIFAELCQGQVRESSRQAMTAIVAGLAARGAQAVILGCTEIGLLIGQDSSPVPVLDTTLLHVEAALDWALA